MASKSKRAKRRRRVLAASCILAALIVAGSSFAWFTSKDEVTNRLTSTADYGVSIVESFAPPKNWLPGQVVNKDVYATNTGNIGAFVEEDVSGVLSVTYENKVAGSANPSTTDILKYVELTQEERYAVEAGAFLALKPAGDNSNALGDQVVTRPGDDNTPDFKPNAAGLYVFRRSIDVVEGGAESFDYQGYYYSGSKYYKVHLDTLTPDNTVDLANDNDGTDGNLLGATYGFYEEKTETVKPVALAYDANGNRLVATYNTGNVTAGAADAALTAAAAAYDKACEDYELALQERTKAATEGNTASGDLTNKSNALQTATQDLVAAQNALKEATIAKATAQAQYDAALTTKTSLQSAVNTSKTSLFGTGGTMASPAAGSLLEKYETALAEYNNVKDTSAADQLATDVELWITNNPTEVEAGHSTLADLTYDELMKFDQTGLSGLKLEVYTKTAAYKLAERNLQSELLNLYGKTIAEISDFDNYDENNSANYTPTSLWGRFKTAESTLTDKQTALGASTDPTTGNSAWAQYNKAEEDLGTDQDSASSTGSAWAKYNKALEDYNSAAGTDAAKQEKLANANQRVTVAKATMDAAQKAYEAAFADASSVGTGDLKINIKLSDKVVTTAGTPGMWQLLPSDPSADKVAKFYYTSILGAGQTSAKLIDSVELDSSVTQDIYKSFDFDLNIELKSAQILYADDNKTILATAANGDGATTGTLDADATLINPTDLETAVTWTART